MGQDLLVACNSSEYHGWCCVIYLNSRKNKFILKVRSENSSVPAVGDLVYHELLFVNIDVNSTTSLSQVIDFQGLFFLRIYYDFVVGILQHRLQICLTRWSTLNALEKSALFPLNFCCDGSATMNRFKPKGIFRTDFIDF